MGMPIGLANASVDSMRTLNVSVHDIVDLILRTGDLDSRIFNRSTMQMGTKLHVQYQREHARSGYQSEVDLSVSWTSEDITLHILGRADGVIVEGDHLIIEEIKTTVADLQKFHEQHEAWHTGQALFYAWMYHQTTPMRSIQIDLMYVHQVTPETLRKTYSFTIEEMERDIQVVLHEFLDFYRVIFQRQNDLKPEIEDLQFPFKAFRHGQRDLAKYAFSVAKLGGRLYVEAPTGIGKTMSTLFPVVKQLGDHLEKIFYFTAKNSGKHAAVDALERLRLQAPSLSYLVITAKDQASFCPKGKINPDDCLYARGYYDRIKDALLDALDHERAFTLPIIQQYAEKHHVDPFEFSLDLSLFVDVIVADYNYLYDPSAYLRRFFEEHASRYVALIDEAHNLVERSREMYSASITKSALRTLKKKVSKSEVKPLKNAVKSLMKAWDLLDDGSPFPRVIAPPKTWIQRLETFLLHAQAEMKRLQASLDDEVMDVYFKLLRFSRMTELYDSHYAYILTSEQEEVTLTLLCLDSSHHVQRIHLALKGVLYFSATLSPLTYYVPMLGAQDADPLLQLPSPFPRNHFKVMVASQVETTLKKRASTLHEITLYLEQLIQGKMGNYLFFFPSYQYLDAVLQAFHPDASIKLYSQTHAMTQEEKQAFLDAFTVQPQQTTIGFAVLGGVFSEGIDLVADRLIGVAIISVGLPGLSFQRDLIADYFSKQGRHGFQFAYGYPAMNKVLQALGRVIRSETDRGVALLLDARYLHPDYAPIFTRYPDYEVILSPEECLQTVVEFFKKD